MRRSFGLSVRPLLGLFLAIIVLVHASAMWSKSPSGHNTAGKSSEVPALHSYDIPSGFQGLFAPSYAQTRTGAFLNAETVPSASYCKHCHEETYHEWRESAHANSFRAPFYTADVNLLINQNGIAYSRHCEGCHNPIALLSGALTSKKAGQPRQFDDEGITCMVCHAIRTIHPGKGLGSYVLGVPAVIVDDRGNPITHGVTDEEILRFPERHKAAVMRDIYRTPEFCGVCHKANLPRVLNDYKWIRAFDTWDEWQASAYSGRTPLTFYGKKVGTCQNCHMPLTEVTVGDNGAKNGVLASHRWIAGNTAIPAYYGFNDQLAATISFLRNQKIGIDIFALREVGREGVDKPWQAPLGVAATSLAPDSDVEVAVVIKNSAIGHSLIPEQRDMYQVWVKFVAKDSEGRIIVQSGDVRQDGTVDPNAHSFTMKILDGSATALEQHEVWRRKATAADISLQSGGVAIARYQFHLPRMVGNQVELTATVLYRHFNEAFTRFVFGGQMHEWPIVDMASQSRSIIVGSGPRVLAKADDTTREWQRWNDWAIGLLSSQRYSDAIDAFQKASQVPGGNVESTNLSFAYYLKRDPIDALKLAKAAISEDPDDARAQLYAALAERDLQQYASSLKRLRQLAQQYPGSVDIHREYAFTLLQNHQEEESRLEYERVQEIDPDDLAAHYYLSIMYERRGDHLRADKEEATFRDERDDPKMVPVSEEYLRHHPAQLEESIAWHVHRLN